ncbi:fatty acid cis/trans isomerase [Vibrio diazotrophicus]|uniref:Fatty acid cis/trans isomerase CTI n=1 Tax=Vibrio diazotrophicus TaxID=685 RepID=A0A329E986_VIBDI|nr:fatty acid cis/trans isomerase [Vibrio diazotrophicus]RAS64222.1 fatty acid cis/trans isomerase CTI [Vibrio diazotrophicus]
MNLRKLFFVFLVLVFSGCATYAGLNYDELFGAPEVRERQVALDSPQAQYFMQEVKPIIDNRCVVCHACYDAPCQLKLSSVEGIDRGASKTQVYEGTRLSAATPTRLFEDAQTTQEWRDFGFHPVLNERDQSTRANLEAGLVARLLKQKELHPQQQQDQLEGFDFSIYREQQCPTLEEHEAYQQEHPDWGMPFGMPNLNKSEYNKLMVWLENGAQMNEHIPLTASQQTLVDNYETLLNADGKKNQLAARYIYEHLFLSHIYFSDLNENTPRFFTLVRSATPPGEPVKRIATRRPYDDPQVDRVYYRIIPEQGTIVDKTHMPYALNKKRIHDWKAWFIDADYKINELPSYEPSVAANPMTAFIDLPVNARYRFLLDNAQNTIMGFIKGPVCRGQLALNVINDDFWVFFLDPDKADIPEVNEFYRSQANNLKLPAEREDTINPIATWISYAKQQARYLEEKSEFTAKQFKDGRYVTTDLIWSGDGTNPNAALTVFRHFDSASVAQGLVGNKPKTAWVFDYALLERVHYLLVAGFDVYGNFGHQLVTRMFMDFLRLEGESNFVTLLPQKTRHEELSSWYEDQSAYFTEFLLRNVKPFDEPSNIEYTTDDPKSELFDKLREHVQPVLSQRYDIVDTGFTADHEYALNSINYFKGEGILPIPQLMMLMIESKSGESQLFTLIHNNAHSNISSLFDEENNRVPENDTLTLVRGVLGSYPAAYLSLRETEIPELVARLKTLDGEESYVQLLDRFAVRRSSPDFWSFSDRVHQWYKQDQPIEFGLLDYNRFENR